MSVEFYTYYNTTTSFDRGYTLHEHYDEFGLINMNGRVYDPYLSTFLSPDNYIQCPDNSQNFNRYAYCLNNPLKYTDPSGEVFGIDDLIIAAVVGAVINVTMNGINNSMSGQDFFNGAGKAAFVGGLAGIAGLCVGSGISSAIAGTGFGAGFIGGGEIAASGFASGAAIGAGSGFASGFITGSGNAWMNGSSFIGGLETGLENGVFSGLSGGLIGGVCGGIDAAMDGRHFITGKKPYFEAKLEGYEVIKQKAPDDMKCKDAILESIEKLNGGTRTQDDFYNMGQAYKDLYISDYYRKAGFNVESINRNNENFTYQAIGENLNSGNPVVYTTNTGDNLNHAKSIIRIRQWTETGKIKV